MRPVRSRDPRTVIKEDTHYVARQGGSDVTFTSISANSTSNSQTSFKISVPSTNTLLSRLIYLTQEFTIVFRSYGLTNANPANKLTHSILNDFSGLVDNNGILNYNADAGICPRAFPISSVISNLTMNINGTLIATPLNTYIHEVAAFQFGEELRTQTVFPSMSDFAQQYNSVSGTNTAFFDVLGNVNPNFQPPLKYDNKQSPFLGYANGILMTQLEDLSISSLLVKPSSVMKQLLQPSYN